MRIKDTSDVLASCAAIGGDALAVVGGFMLAVWLRFDSGLLPLFYDSYPPRLYTMYFHGALLTALVFCSTFQALGLYVRPQVGVFGDRVPRLIRGIGVGSLVAVALAFILRTDPPFSRLTAVLAVPVVTLLVILERWLLFHWEIRLARRRQRVNRVMIIGTDAIAARLLHALRHEPRLRSEVMAFLRIGDAPPHADIPPELLRGVLDDVRAVIERDPPDQVILTDAGIGHQRMVELILLCEQHLTMLNIVPDLFRIMTDTVDLQSIDGIPLLGVRHWPLDHFWNRLLKRMEDVLGALLGLVLAGPLMLLIAVWIRRDSPGPVLFRQQRCGEGGRVFTLYKLRTMRVDAETAGQRAWTVADDPRRTAAGTWLRRLNLDELPQLWNVLRGEMSLVGPRPERPCFVEHFKEDINRYMWRHVSKPGLTGWAQVNGLRGDTDIRERVKYDLYYLEHWSLAFDFKIMAKTLLAHRNAY
ncbi:MAG: exopolysaccharide biosynthesis polyprenyl glycosylphosphotransferase [Kiritimatiellia bacterium]|nr:exopolysaccharide biosynthesis polyprenyl glycosylphosphotransferase [Lentisphaerota bacterium]